MYQNSGYTNTRNRKRTLILDISDGTAVHGGMSGAWNIALREPLIIDKHSEIYMDNFMTHNCNLNSSAAGSHIAFALRINEFQIDNHVATTVSSSESIISNSIIIPNENNSSENYFSAVVHKGKKFNYVCDINPSTIHSLSGSLTDLLGNTIFHGDQAENNFTYALVGIEVWANTSSPAGTEDRALHDLEIIDSITYTDGAASPVTIINTVGTTNTAQIVVNTIDAAATIYFTSSVELVQTAVIGQTVTITLPGRTASATQSALQQKTIVLNASVNPSIMLIQSGARAIAEFSIISRTE